MVRPSTQIRNVTEDLTAARPYKKITKVAEIRKLLLVEYYDGHGERSVQVAAVLEGGTGESVALLLPENVGGRKLTVPAAEWFNTQLREKLGVSEVQSV